MNKRKSSNHTWQCIGWKVQIVINSYDSYEMDVCKWDNYWRKCKVYRNYTLGQDKVLYDVKYWWYSTQTASFTKNHFTFKTFRYNMFWTDFRCEVLLEDSSWSADFSNRRTRKFWRQSVTQSPTLQSKQFSQILHF